MKLILIDGGPASGKNTLGEILVDDFYANGDKSILLDHDTYVEKLCPTWVWNNDEQKEKDLLTARTSFVNNIDKFLKENYNVVAIGAQFIRNDEVELYTSKLTEKPSVYLYHLSVPIELRRQRLHDRGPHSLIDLDKDQMNRDKITTWPGYVYQNINSPEFDAKKLMQLIRDNKGLMNINNP